MVNSVIDAICLAISKAFGDKEIYTEEVKQGFLPPCFFISGVNLNENRYIGKRYKHAGKYEINYFSAEESANREINEVSEKLSEILETIEVDDGLMRGTKMEATISDNVLSFIVHYDCFVYRDAESKSVMEKVRAETEVKGG